METVSSLESWACLVSTYVINDIAEHFPETSDAVMAQISESIIKTVEHLWPNRPSDSADEGK